MRHHIILRVAAKLLIPFIMLFALYVQFHGDYGPGGGFQAGVIFAAAIVLYTMIFGYDAARRIATPGLVRTLGALGLLLYAGTGLAPLFLGGNFLEYGVLLSDPLHGQHLGIILIEFGVGVTVAAAMVSAFFCFVGRSRS